VTAASPTLRRAGARALPAGAAGRYWLAVGVLTLVAAGLRIPSLGGPSLWFDEAVTLSLVRRDLGSMLALLAESESTPPLYYLVAWAWARLAGDSEAMVRGLSALAGVAVVPVAYAAGARLATRRVGFALAAVCSVSPLLVWHSQDARAYSLLVLLSALTLLAVGRAADAGRGRDLAAWAIASILALATHYFAVFLVLGEAIWLLARVRRRRRVALAAGAVVAAAAALAPLALQQRGHGGAAWLAARGLGGRVESLWTHFAAGYGSAPAEISSYELPTPTGLTIAAAVLAGVAIVLAVALAFAGRWLGGSAAGERSPAAHAVRGERRGLAAAAVLVATAIGLPLLLALGGTDYVFSRNLLPGWLALALAVALGVGARRAGAAGAALGLALCGVLAAITLSAAAAPRTGPDDWSRVGRALGDPREARVVQAPAAIAMPLALDRPGLVTVAAAGRRVREVVVLLRGARRHRRRPPAPGFELLGRRTVGRSFTLFRYRSARPALVTPGTITLDKPLRQRRTAVLLDDVAAARRRPGGTEPPRLRFCAPATGELRVVSVTTACAEAFPRPRVGAPSRGATAR